jgi:hypothetical protein
MLDTKRDAGNNCGNVIVPIEKRRKMAKYKPI